MGAGRLPRAMGASAVARAVLALGPAAPAVGAGAPTAGAVASVPFQFSEHDDLTNQELAISYFEGKFYNAENRWSLQAEHLAEAHALGQAALEVPSLALGAAQVLYLFAWYRRTGEIIRESVALAARLFELSAAAAGCSPEVPTEAWLQLACDLRVGQAMLLDSWLGETDADEQQGRLYTERAYALLDFLKSVPRFADVSRSWSTPLHMNFNQFRYGNPESRPIWDNAEVPLAGFLEDNFHTFQEELRAIIEHPGGDLYEALRKADGSIESLAPPGSWDAIRVVRYGHWFDAFCAAAPRSCALLRSRPEIADCPYVNTNYYKLHPAGHLKPHFGNAPRLTVHLAVIAPEPLRSGISVGPEFRLWTEGKAMVLDDTYPHAVSHWGKEPRYVLASWFCHPCDTNNNPGPDAYCPDWVGGR